VPPHIATGTAPSAATADSHQCAEESLATCLVGEFRPQLSAAEFQRNCFGKFLSHFFQRPLRFRFRLRILLLLSGRGLLPGSFGSFSPTTYSESKPSRSGNRQTFTFSKSIQHYFLSL
jgi:hypothetical protein